MFPLLVFLLINTTLEHGINASSCDGFSGFGVLLWWVNLTNNLAPIQSSHLLSRIQSGVLGKPRRGREMAKVAKLLLAKPNMERMKCRTTFICEGCINHWTTPIQDTIAPLMEAYMIGLENGDVESAGNAGERASADFNLLVVRVNTDTCVDQIQPDFVLKAASIPDCHLKSVF